MEYPAHLCRVLITLFPLLLAACAGPTKPDIPASLPVLGETMARIVFTREKQVAGAGSPFIVIDIGEQIDANGMIRLTGLPLNRVLENENIASVAGVSLDFLWFDRRAVKPLYCADNGPGCIVYHWRWPKKEWGTLLAGYGVQIQADCRVRYEPLNDSEFYLHIMRHERLPIAIPADHLCFKEEYLPSHDEARDKRYLKVEEIIGAPAHRYPGGFFYLMTERFTSISDSGSTFEAEVLHSEAISRQVQVVGSAEVGETLIWDRRPGVMRLGSVWYDGVGFMPRNLEVEAGRTYYLHYTTRFGQRWEIKRVE